LNRRISFKKPAPEKSPSHQRGSKLSSKVKDLTQDSIDKVVAFASQGTSTPSMTKLKIIEKPVKRGSPKREVPHKKQEGMLAAAPIKSRSRRMPSMRVGGNLSP